MIKAITIFFITLYSLVNTPFSEALKLPVLLSHFIQHQKNAPGISLLSYIYGHYAYGNVKDSDYEQDMKLPFKTIVANPVQCNLFTPQQFFIIIKRVAIQLKKSNSLPYAPKLVDTYLCNIWQPPKFSC